MKQLWRVPYGSLCFVTHQNSGYITSDTDAVGDIWTEHKYAKTGGEASCLAIKDGGCDMVC